MFGLIIDNFATIIVAAIIAVLVFAAVRKIRKDRKAGIHSCGGNCSGCAMGQMCAGESALDKGCRTTGESTPDEGCRVAGESTPDEGCRTTGERLSEEGENAGKEM